MITLTLDWRETLWLLQGAMSGSHLRWSAYEDMVNRVWPQCDEQERRNIFWIMRRDLGYWWRPEGYNGYDRTMKGEGPWKADDEGYAIDRTDPDAKPRQVITDLTPWMYFRKVLARFDPDRQMAVTLQARSQTEARTVYDDARQRGILIPRDEDYGWSSESSAESVLSGNAESRQTKAKASGDGHRKGRLTVTVRAYEWQGDYRIDWNKRCDPDRIVKADRIDIPDTGETRGPAHGVPDDALWHKRSH